MSDQTDRNDQADHWAQEAKERWGGSGAYRESVKRTRNYDAEAKASIAAELDLIESDFAEALAAGVPAHAPLARGIAERARLHIDRWYYPCPARMHVGLAEMYTADDRFRAHYDDRAEGLATYVAGAIRANAEHATA